MQILDQAVQSLRLLRDSVVRPAHIMIVFDPPGLVRELDLQGPDNVAVLPDLVHDPDAEAGHLHSALPVRPVKLAFPLNLNYNLTFLRTAKHKNAFDLVHPDHLPKVLNRMRQRSLCRYVLSRLAG